MDPSLTTTAMRLHIAFAKLQFTEAERRAAEDLARQVTDWDAFLATAGRNFSLPNVRMHVAQMDPECVPQSVRTELRSAANASAMRNMLLISAQRKFKENVLDPMKAQALFFKGISLVGQYYPDLGLRPCRDIDVLVRPDALRPIVLNAIDHGYKLVVPGQPERPLESAEEINALLHYRNDASLLSPEGMALDLQVKLDKYSDIFAGHDFFGEAMPVSLGGFTFDTMPPAMLFNYLCHHHARHVWSRLHWLSDIDAMVSAPQFDREQTISLADELGQRGTVEASLEMQKLMSPTADWTETSNTRRGLQFLDLSLRNLTGDLDLEKRIGFSMKGGEFMFEWQADPALIRRARRNYWKKMIRPTIRQYRRFPLPRGLRWLYFIPRFIHLMGRTRDRARKEAE